MRGLRLSTFNRLNYNIHVERDIMLPCDVPVIEKTLYQCDEGGRR